MNVNPPDTITLLLDESRLPERLGEGPGRLFDNPLRSLLPSTGKAGSWAVMSDWGGKGRSMQPHTGKGTDHGLFSRSASPSWIKPARINSARNFFIARSMCHRSFSVNEYQDISPR